MSRIHRNPAPSTTRRAPMTRSSPCTSTADHCTPCRARAPIRGRTMYTRPQQQARTDNNPHNGESGTEPQERTVHVGDGYHMFTPSNTKREQVRRQAEHEQRQYEIHIEQKRLHNIHEVHRLGGDDLSQDEVRRRQAEKYRQEKFARLEKAHQDRIKKKQEERSDMEAKKQAARHQSTENEKMNRLHSIKTILDQDNEEPTAWTDAAREADRKATMDRFFDQLTCQANNINIASDNNEIINDNVVSQAEKLPILRDIFPHVDDQTLAYYLDVYNSNVDAIISELINQT